MDFQVGKEAPLTPNIEEHAAALTQLESATQEIHKSLNAILDYQTHHRLVTMTLTLENCVDKINRLSFSFPFISGKRRAERMQRI